jgi:hypothetical protein
MLHSVAKLVLELAVVLIAIVVAAAVIARRRPEISHLRAAAAPATAAVIAVVAAAQIPHAFADLNRARRSAVSARAGAEHCFHEVGPSQPISAVPRLPFINWVKARIGSHAVYRIAYTGPPDFQCVTMALLPALPAVPGERPNWTVAFGLIPPAMQALIARHDPSVMVYGPGFALERNS